VFVTGTDTGAGKSGIGTTRACRLARRGARAAGRGGATGSAGTA
jgi:dethiobiotin synthetase